MQLVIFFLRSILRTLIQIISMCILNVHILEVAREFFALWHSKWKQTSTKILIFQKKKFRSLQRHKICLLVVWNVRDYNVYDALYAYGLHTFAFAYVFVIMLKNIESHFQRAGLSICSCLPNHLHSNEDCAFSMGNCIERPEMRNEQNTFALFKNGQILVHIHVHCFGFSSAAVHRRTKHSSFSISRRNSDAFAWLKSIFAFSSMLLPHTLSLRSPFVSRSKFGGLCKWFWLCHSVWQFDLYSFWKSFSFACMFACLYIISAESKSQQMSEFNIRSANTLNNLRTTILGTLLISTIAIMDGNEWQFSCLTNNLLEERSTNIGDGIDNDFRIIVFSLSFGSSWQSFGPLTLMAK